MRCINYLAHIHFQPTLNDGPVSFLHCCQTVREFGKLVYSKIISSLLFSEGSTPKMPNKEFQISNQESGERGIGVYLHLVARILSHVSHIRLSWVGCHALLQGIFLTKLPLCLLHWQEGSLPLALPGKSKV